MYEALSDRFLIATPSLSICDPLKIRDFEAAGSTVASSKCLNSILNESCCKGVDLAVVGKANLSPKAEYNAFS